MASTNAPHSAEPLWKILLPEEAAQLIVEGTFPGSADDRRDGFIHLSGAAQVAGTLAKHFAGAVGLIGAQCDPAQMGEDLRWDVSRGGALFPHLYRPLRLADVTLLVPCAETRLAGPDEPPGHL